MDLLALADFNLVAKHGGFGRASRAAGRPKATLSRRVADLETALGMRLLERGRRDVRLTEEGKALFARTDMLLAELDETALAIASGGSQVRGRLRISAPLLFSQVAMGHLAAEFVLRHSDVRLDVTTDDRQVDMIEEGYDLVIRVNPPADAALIGRAFLHDYLVMAAAPHLSQGSDGKAVPAVVRGADGPVEWTIETADGTTLVPVDPVLRLSSLTMVRDAVRAGVGAGLLPISLVANDLAEGRLSNWGKAAGMSISLWALYPSRRLLSARVSAFLDHLKRAFPEGRPEELADYVRRSDGRPAPGTAA